MGARYGKGSIVAVVLNLEKGSPNHNTISLFRDGKRVTKPQALPSALQGKPLYPTVTYRNLAVALSFGPQPQAPLPFTCHMPQLATATQATLTEAEKETEYEVLFPICLPDQGGFDWLDSFKKKNPKYTEISDRMLLDWAEKSGIYAPKGVGSNDKPDLRFGIPEMDDMSIRRMIQSIAPLQKRNYIVMEVRGNLIKETRADALSTYFDSCYKKVAKVVVGDASKDFVKMSQELMLAEKQEQSDKEFKMKKEEAARKKAAEKKMKEIEKAKKKAEKERQKKLEEMKKEKKMKFRKTALPDVASSLLNRCFTKFTVPDLEEGFDDISYEWSQGGKAGEYVTKWIKEKKLTSRVEDLTPSVWFKTKASAWQKVLSQWQAKVPEYKSKLVKKAQAKQAKENKKKMAEAKAAAEKAKKEAEKAEKEAKEEEKDEEVKEEEEKAEPMEVEEEEEEEEEEADFEGVDIFGVEEVDDIGGGMPLYKEFAHEDWALMSLSFELHLMAHAFKKDCDDPDRKGIVLEHLAFYYQKYYGKQLNLKSYGIENEAQLVDLAKDCVFINKDKVLESLLDEEIEYPQVFVKIAEEGRRHRALLVDMGDESAKLKITHAVSSHHHKGGNYGGGKDSGKGMKGHSKGYGKGIMPVGPIGMGPMQQGMGAPMAGMAPMAPMGNMGKGKDFGKGYGHMPFGKGGKGWKGK
ncbi:HNRNPUL1 [Symbiodinium sp. CCMP2592]|nr:HNRNPUL1 [Symbiodinium sp. CCMP2592]